MARTLNVGMIGYKFMGKAHSNAYRQVNQFFDIGIRPQLKIVCGREKTKVEAMAQRWGWEKAVTDWRQVVEDKSIDLVDICSPNNTHCEIALAALEAGKIVACEKPLAMDGREAKQMAEAARRKKATTLVWFNYRRVPAIAFARKLIEQGRIGKIFHFRALYLQDWTLSPEVPLLWRMDKAVAGSGVTGDLLSHLVDISNYLAGDIESVAATSTIFVDERPLPQGGRAKVEIEDAAVFLARYKNGALGHFEATRFANGRKNANTFEVNGDKGSLYFNLEDMSRLWYFDGGDPKEVQGFRCISVWEEGHPYMRNWWVPGCAIGYEHTFTNALADLLEAIAKGEKAKPDFDDGLKCQLVLDAVLEASRKQAWVRVGSAAAA